MNENENGNINKEWSINETWMKLEYGKNKNY